MELFYREMGQGRPLIILHGLFGMSDNWMKVAKALSSEYQVYLPDQRNHGNSPHSDEWNYASMASDLAELIERHQINEPILIGHSMGGKTAMEFITTFPELVQKLVVVDIGPKYYPPHHQLILEAMNALDLSSIHTRQDADEALKEKIGDWGIRQFLLKNLKRDNDSFSWKHNLGIITEKIEEVGRSTMPEWPVEIPTLFIKGERSDYIQDEDFDDIKSVFVNAQIVTIKNAGHWVHAEQQDALVKTLEAFIES